MANPLFQFNVTGLAELTKNLAEFGGPRVLTKIVGQSMRAGAAIPLRQAKINARALGLGFMGYAVRRDPNGKTHGAYRRYGRIPVALKANRAYRPRGMAGAYRLNVLARSQRGRGIYRNKAPHAHLVEFGFRHWKGGVIAGRPFLGPALDSTAARTIQAIADRMDGLIDGLKFPTTGRGP